MPLDINMLENIILWVLRFVYMIYNRTIDLKNESKTAHDEINTLKTEIEALKKQNEKFKMEVVLLESRTWSQKRSLRRSGGGNGGGIARCQTTGWRVKVSSGQETTGQGQEDHTHIK